MDQEVIDSVKEILRINNELKILRQQTRDLEKTRDSFRETLFTKFGNDTTIQTPFGIITLQEHERIGKFSLEDIHGILESIPDIPYEIKNTISQVFEREADSLQVNIRTMTVRKPHSQTRKRRHRNKNKTSKLQIEDTPTA